MTEAASRRVALRCVAGLALLLPLAGWAQVAAPAVAPAGPVLPLLIGQGAGGNSYSVPMQTLLFFTALSCLPAVLLMRRKSRPSSTSSALPCQPVMRPLLPWRG